MYSAEENRLRKNERQREYRKRNRGKIKKYNKEYYASHYVPLLDRRIELTDQDDGVVPVS